MSEIEELVDHVDELLGEIEEEVLKRDQLIQYQNQIIRTLKTTPNLSQEDQLSREAKPVHSILRVTFKQLGLDAIKNAPIHTKSASLIRQVNPEDPLLRQVNPEEPSSFEQSPLSDLLKLATRNLTEIKSATARARECLFTQVRAKTWAQSYKDIFLLKFRYTCF